MRGCNRAHVKAPLPRLGHILSPHLFASSDHTLFLEFCLLGPDGERLSWFSSHLPDCSLLDLGSLLFPSVPEPLTPISYLDLELDHPADRQVGRQPHGAIRPAAPKRKTWRKISVSTAFMNASIW